MGEAFKRTEFFEPVVILPYSAVLALTLEIETELRYPDEMDDQRTQDLLRRILTLLVGDSSEAA